MHLLLLREKAAGLVQRRQSGEGFRCSIGEVGCPTREAGRFHQVEVDAPTFSEEQWWPNRPPQRCRGP